LPALGPVSRRGEGLRPPRAEGGGGTTGSDELPDQLQGELTGGTGAGPAKRSRLTRLGPTEGLAFDDRHRQPRPYRLVAYSRRIENHIRARNGLLLDWGA